MVGAATERAQHSLLAVHSSLYTFPRPLYVYLRVNRTDNFYFLFHRLLLIAGEVLDRSAVKYNSCFPQRCVCAVDIDACTA